MAAGLVLVSHNINVLYSQSFERVDPWMQKLTSLASVDATILKPRTQLMFSPSRRVYVWIWLCYRGLMYLRLELELLADQLELPNRA